MIVVEVTCDECGDLRSTTILDQSMSVGLVYEKFDSAGWVEEKIDGKVCHFCSGKHYNLYRQFHLLNKD